MMWCSVETSSQIFSWLRFLKGFYHVSYKFQEHFSIYLRYKILSKITYLKDHFLSKKEVKINDNTTKYQRALQKQHKTKALSQFYAKLWKENGEDYEPDQLKVMQAALHKYLKLKSYPKSILWGREFVNSRKVPEEKARILRQQGKGKRPNRSKMASLAVKIHIHL